MSDKSEYPEDAPPYASFFGSMGSAAAIIFTGIAESGALTESAR